METRRQKTLYSRVGALWRREQILYIGAGTLALCRWGIPLFLGGVAVDWTADLSAFGRFAILAVLLSVSTYKAWRAGWRHVRSFNVTRAALRMEKHVGGLESLLVTAVELRNAEAPAGISRSLIDLTCRRAEEAAAPLRPEEAVRYHKLKAPAKAVLVLAAVMGLFAILNGPFLAVGAARIFAPWLAISYPTRTQVALLSGDLIVKEGGQAKIRARVSGVVPEQAKVALQTGRGKARRHSLPISDGICEYVVGSAFRSFEYRIIAGDGKSAWRSVKVIPSPRISHASVSLEFPSYTRRPAETVEALTVSVPEGTRIGWALTLDRAVSKATFDLAGEKPIPLEVGPDGRSVKLASVATESRAYSFSWVERERGFTFQSPSQYLLCAPDQPPHVELSSPRQNLYATLGRGIDLAYRGRDDYGIGEVAIAYRVDKTEEEKVALPPPTRSEGGEQRIDWDYRTVLPDLKIGNTVSFAIELADRYPGPDGPHRVRSQSRRVSFLSREDYLERIARHKRRLLGRLRGIYREERKVHEIIRGLDPLDDVFVQTCQLEAVRQDLVRERLLVLSSRMNGLIDDLAANNIKDEKVSAILVKLRTDLRRVADEHVGSAASSLRDLAAASNRKESARTGDPAPAAHKVDGAARELGVLMMQLSFRDAAEAMARELHAVAQAQASLRARAITTQDGATGAPSLSKSQDELARWLTRLFAATPWYRESTPDDALIAFILSSLVRRLGDDGADAKMREAAALIGEGKPVDAARIQAGVVAKLLHAEFRLRVGAEHEALSKARELFQSQAREQKRLRLQSAALRPDAFAERRVEIARAQRALRLRLQELLMPAIPAPRPRLFDVDLPTPPAVEDLLTTAETSMDRAAESIASGDRDAGARQQQKAEGSLHALASIAAGRIGSIAQAERAKALLSLCAEGTTKIGLFEERMLALIEKAEDAAADRSASAHLAGMERVLADDVEKFRAKVVKSNAILATPRKNFAPLLGCLDKATQSLKAAIPLLKGNKPGKAVAHQEAAHGELARAARMIEEQATGVAAFAAALADARAANRPGPYVAEIEAEQRVVIRATQKAKQADRRRLAVAQKNLVHAVNAVLDSLDFLADKIDSGTVMLFAKDDMDSAGEALETDDMIEAADAQDAVADALSELGAKLDAVAPRYDYVLEVTESLYEVMPDCAAIHTGQTRLCEKASAAPDAEALRALADEQRALTASATVSSELLNRITGKRYFGDALRRMTGAAKGLDAGDRAAALREMKLAEGSIGDDRAELLELIELLPLLLAPPAGPKLAPEVVLIRRALAVATEQKALYRETRRSAPKHVAALAARQRPLEQRCAAIITPFESHPNAVSARKRMAEAASALAASSGDEAVALQQKADASLRHLILEQVLEHVVVPGPPPPGDPVPSYDVGDTEEFKMFMPGAVSGVKPKGGRGEWEVLGRRDRAALNENFARELPLEYRAILKDYYERLAK